MELTALKFASDTTELERAAKVIGDLVTDISKLDKASRDAAKTEATLARAAKDNAKANLDNTKAQEASRKSVEATENAQLKAAAATEKKTKATERATVATKHHIDMLQFQKDTYEFILEGFSKGDAKVLALANATGQLSGQLKQVLIDIRQFSKDPFDQTEAGLNRMVKSAKEASAAQVFFNQGFNITAKQAKELVNDLDRLNIRLQHQGKSYGEIVKAQAVYKQQFLEEAKAVNQANNALAAIEKQRKEVVTATNYLTQADAKMAAALNTSNTALGKAGTDSLVRYESALRKSGVSQDVATAKLATYKAQLTQVNALEQKRREQHLTRSLAPQATDVVVSLWSGQNPLTVLLQQGGQINDLFMQSGVAAEKFGEVVKSSMKSMLPSILVVVKGVGGLLVDGLTSAGNAVTRFVGNVTGITSAMEIAKRAIVSGGEANFKYIASLDKIGERFSAVAATGIAAMIAGMILLGLEYKKIIQAEAELTNALATSGGALGISKTEAIAAAEGMASLGVGTLKAVVAITEIAKAGNIGKESLELITKSAIDLEKTAGISIEETAKQFAKLQEEPAKALTEIAQKTGLVDKATLDYVYALEQQGDKTEAARVATLALASAHAQAASEIRDNWSPIEALWNDIKSAIGRVKQEIYDLTTSNVVVSALRTVWEAVSVTISEVWFTIKGVGKEIGGIGAQIAAVMRGDFSQAAEIGKQMEIDAVAARQAQDEFTASLMDRSKQETKFFNQSKEQNSEYAKWRRENARSLEEGISKEDRYKAKQLEIQKAVLAGTITQIEADKSLAGWKKIILGEEKSNKKDPSENYYATLMREATNNTIAANTATQELTKSEQKLLEVKADPRFAKLTATQQADVIAKYDAAIAAERQTAMTEKLAEAEEHRLKLLGKSEGIGKQYYADMQKLEEFAKVAGWSREEIEELTRAVFRQTPAWKAYEKALEDVNTASKKFKEDSLASQASVLQENQSLDYRLSLLGKTAEEQKAITIEYQRANKIREVDIKLARQLREIEEKIAEAKKKGLPESDYKSLIDAGIQARKDAAEQQKVINREVAVQYAEDMQREIDAIKSGISDSIVTALFEGGKAGSKKLRNLIVDQLKKPVTLVVQAAVNLLLGSLMGSVGLGGLASSALGSAGGSLLGSAAGSAAGGMFGNFLGGGSLTGMISNITAGVTNGISTLFSQGIGSVFSQGTGLMAAGSAGGGLGTLLGGIGLPLLGIGALISGLSRKLKDVGIEGSFGGDTGFEGRKYKFYKGGFLRSNKTTYENLDPELQKDLGNAFLGMKKSVADMANTLGLGTEALEKFKTNIKVSFWNLKDDEIQAKLQEALATANNELAEQVLGTWETTTSTVEETITASTYKASEYAREGEKAIDTLTRLATSLSTVNTTFGYLGNTLYDTSLAGADLASQLVEVFGGIEAFTAITSGYYDSFYSDNEKQAAMYRDLEKSLSAMGLSVPKTKDEFRALIEAQDLTTESGRKNYAALMRLSSTFSEMIGITDDLTQAENDRVSAAREAAIQQMRDYLNIQIEAAESQMNIWQRLFDFLDQEVKKLYGSVSSTAAMQVTEARSIISSVLATGKFPDQQVFEDAVNTVTGSFSGTNYASKVEADRDRLRFAAQLDDLRSVADNELKTAKNTFDLLKLQLAALEDSIVINRQQLQALSDIDSSIQNLGYDIAVNISNVIGSSSSNSSTYGGNRYTGGGGGIGYPPGGGKYIPSQSRVDYSSTEALGSREKFTNWYQGLQQNATFNKDYQVPDWMRMITLSSPDELGLYLFFKNNPELAADYERIMTGGVSQQATGGSSLIQSDLSKMPPEVAEYFRNNPSALLSYEGFGLDPTLARMAYTGGVEQFGISNRDTNVTEWLRTHRWENGSIVESDNTLLFSHVGQDKYPNARWDTQTGTVVDLDGTIYATDGTIVGRANPELMYQLYGLDTNRDIRSRYDVYINSGLTADDLIVRMQTEGVTMQEVAAAYGATPDEIADNLRAAGAQNIPAYADGGSYRGGLALVGEEGPELINFNKGGYIHTASQSREIMSQDGVIQALNTLNNRVEMLEAAARSTAISNNKIAKLLDRITPDGDSMQVKTVTGSVTTTV